MAEALRQRIAGTRGIERVEITGPGFLNFTLVPDGSGTVVRTVLAEGAGYGTGSSGAEPHPATAPAGTGGPARGTSATATDHPRLDAARWGALFGGAGAGLLVRRESNPLFRVQYAHARSRALLRNARDLGFRAAYGTEYDAACERDREAAALVAALADYPAAVESATGPGPRETPVPHPRPSARGTGSPGSSSWSPMPSWRSTSGCSPSGTRNPRPPTAPGSPSPRPPGRCWQAACPCSVSAHPNTSERAKR